MSTPLPERPHLEHLKKLAKSLLREAEAGDQTALARFSILPAHRGLALHEAQSVIAREHGFVSWNALREEVEARTMTFETALEEFLRCAGDGAPDRARRLLALHPAIGRANVYAAAARGDVESVRLWLADRPGLASTPGGPLGWPPLLYACHSSLQRQDPSVRNGVLAVAEVLLVAGADANELYHWNWHPELPRTPLWAALCVHRHYALAELLLRSGAHVTDGVSGHIAAGSGDLDALNLLLRFGLLVNGIAGGVPPLPYILHWGRTPEGAQWLLDHGADPNLSWGPLAEAPLHTAARRWDLDLVTRLVERGADVNAGRGDGRTPHTLAAMAGNDDVARWLMAHGADDTMTLVDRYAAACGRGDRAAAAAMRATTPSLPTDLSAEHHRMLDGPAESGQADVLIVMLEGGFNPHVPDHDRVTPLHRAAMGGWPAAVEALLAHGADVHALDGMFSATPLVWAVEGRTHPADGADHVAVARLLIAAGSPTTWEMPEGAPGPERTMDGLRELVNEAMGQ